MPDLRKIPDAILRSMIDAARVATDPGAKEGLSQLSNEARRRGMRLPDATQLAKPAEPQLESVPPMSGLEGQRVRLSPLAKPFANVLFRWLNTRDPDSLAGDFGPMTEVLFEEWFKEKSLPPFIMFVITLKSANTPIGWCSLNLDSGFGRTAEMSVVLCEATARGKGFGREALALLLDHAFHDRDLARIQLTTRADNARALACFEALGFQREGVLREARFGGGRRHDQVIMGLLQREHRAPAG